MTAISGATPHGLQACQRENSGIGDAAVGVGEHTDQSAGLRADALLTETTSGESLISGSESFDSLSSAADAEAESIFSSTEAPACLTSLDPPAIAATTGPTAGIAHSLQA